MLKAPSLRTRLIVGLLVPLIALRFVSGHLHASNLAQQIEGLQDAYLEDTLRGLEKFVAEIPEDQLTARLGRMLQVVQRSHLSTFLFAIRKVDTGERIIGDDWPGDHTLRAAVQFRTTEVGNKPFRVISKVLSGTPTLGLELARESTATLSIIEDSEEYVVLVQTLMILLVILVVSVVIRRSLSTLDDVVKGVSSRGFSTPRPLHPNKVPAEIVPLIRTMDKAFTRLQEEHDNQQSFVELASHQLKTPVAGMRATIEDLIRQGILSKDTAETHRLMVSLDRMQSLCGKLMSLFRVTTKALPPAGAEAQGKVDAIEVAKSVVESLFPLAVKREIDLGFHSEPAGAPSVMFPCNAEEMNELVYILVDNAIRYSPAGGHVDVVVFADNPPRMSIVDSGPGIPNDLRERVFERFFRVLGTGEEGSGLGLSIAKVICERNRLRIYVTDGPQGNGSSFHIEPDRSVPSEDGSSA